MSSFVCQTCGKELSCQKSLDRHHLTVYVPWFAREVVCEYCEKAFETSNILCDHVTSQDHKARVKTAQAQKRKVKRWQEMRREYFTRHCWAWAEAISAKIISNGHAGGTHRTGTCVTGGPKTPLLDEQPSSDDFSSILEVASQLSSEGIAAASVDSGLEEVLPPPKKPRTDSLRENISTRVVTEQNKLIADAA